jgi:hypothetical protein
LPHAVDARSAVAEIARGDDLVRREGAEHVRRGAEDLGAAVVSDERPEERLDVGRVAREERREEQLVEHRGERGREDAPRVPQPVARHEHAQQLELVEDRAPHEGGALRVAHPHRGALERLARIVDEVQQRGARGLVEALGEEPLDEGPQAARAIAQHVLELLELAVHVAEHVDRPAWQREHGREMRDLGERRRHVGEPVAERTQMRERRRGHGHLSGYRRTRSVAVDSGGVRK